MATGTLVNSTLQLKIGLASGIQHLKPPGTHPAPFRRQAVLDVSRGWHTALAAALALVPTALLSCVLDAEDEDEDEEDVGMGGTMPGKGGPMPCPACTHTACGTLRAAMEQLHQLSPRTLRVRLEGFDWSLVRGSCACWAC